MASHAGVGVISAKRAVEASGTRHAGCITGLSPFGLVAASSARELMAVLSSRFAVVAGRTAFVRLSSARRTEIALRTVHTRGIGGGIHAWVIFASWTWVCIGPGGASGTVVARRTRELRISRMSGQTTRLAHRTAHTLANLSKAGTPIGPRAIGARELVRRFGASRTVMAIRTSITSSAGRAYRSTGSARIAWKTLRAVRSPTPGLVGARRTRDGHS